MSNTETLTDVMLLVLTILGTGIIGWAYTKTRHPVQLVCACWMAALAGFILCRLTV